MKTLGFCGLNCEECPVFVATANNDNGLRQKPPENGLLCWSISGVFRKECKRESGWDTKGCSLDK
ncbi:Uncharacterised protein [uncultured archaeon]|nr:Uncharacterised protein [uncultured archaeon]